MAVCDFASNWDSFMHNRQFGLLLGSSWQHPSVRDVLAFVLVLSAKVPANHRGMPLLLNFANALLVFLADCFRHYFIEIWEPVADSPGPVLRAANNPRRPKRVEAATAWSLLQKAKRLKLSAAEVIRVDNDRPELSGNSVSTATRWSDLLLSLWMTKRNDIFRDCVQLSFSADPSTHNGEETCVSAGYSWRKGIGAYGNIAIIPRSKAPKPADVDALPDIEIMIQERRVDRWGAFKEVRALSATTKRFTGRELKTFALPPGFIVRPIGQREIRAVTPQHIAYIIELGDDGREVRRWQEMPSEFDPFAIPLLVIYLDQGSTLRAGLMCLVNDVKLLIDPRWDSFHRGPNDLKLAENGASRKVFRRVRLALQFIFALNYGSYGKGDKFIERKRDAG